MTFFLARSEALSKIPPHTTPGADDDIRGCSWVAWRRWCRTSDSPKVQRQAPRPGLQLPASPRLAHTAPGSSCGFSVRQAAVFSYPTGYRRLRAHFCECHHPTPTPPPVARDPAPAPRRQTPPAVATPRHAQAPGLHVDACHAQHVPRVDSGCCEVEAVVSKTTGGAALQVDLATAGHRLYKDHRLTPSICSPRSGRLVSVCSPTPELPSVSDPADYHRISGRIHPPPPWVSSSPSTWATRLSKR